MSNLLVFVKKQRVFMFINHICFQNIFQLNLEFFAVQLMLSCCWCILHILHFFYFVKQFFPRNPLSENIFEKSFLPFDKAYFVVSFHAKKLKWPKCHIQRFYFVEQQVVIEMHYFNTL